MLEEEKKIKRYNKQDSQNNRHESLSKRRRSRELALCTLYAYEVDPSEKWQPMLESIAENDFLSEKVMQYASKLVDTAVKNLAAIDEIISRKAANWELRRMAAVDRNVLRIAVGELAFSDEGVPYKVVIDEAVEIAKSYGTDDSGKFVNGILDSIRKDLQRKAEGNSVEKEKETKPDSN